jgi:ribonuclease T1
MPRTRSIGLLALACLTLIVAACAGTGSPSPSGTRTLAPTQPVTLPASDPVSGLPVVRLADLPPQAAETLALIDAGGPFPNRQDGATFQNRERILPAKPKGYYREYTVQTPGSDDRGARRIVTGRGGELYWTADHYDSFSWIAR